MKMEFNINEHQHQRYNPLRGEWILVSPHRCLRPWSGQRETVPPETIARFDPNNPLCPGVDRPNGAKNPDYTSTFVFTNDYPALLEEGPKPSESDDPLFRMEEAKGTCRVICYHPYSDMYIHSLSITEIVDIIEEWIRQIEELGKKYLWVQIFENRTTIMGCSNPHPHGQVWASSFFPNEPKIKDRHLRDFYLRYGKPLLIDYVEKELKKDERVVYQNDEWVVVVPFWAVWPFETMVLPKRQVQRLTEVTDAQKLLLADAMKVLVCKYDNIFKCNFPYSMGWHGAPTGEKLNQDQPYWTFHGLYYPPLLRSATVRKFMVGYEMLAQGQRDLSPEKAAKMLRRQPNERFAM